MPFSIIDSHFPALIHASGRPTTTCGLLKLPWCRHRKKLASASRGSFKTHGNVEEKGKMEKLSCRMPFSCMATRCAGMRMHVDVQEKAEAVGRSLFPPLFHALAASECMPVSRKKQKQSLPPFFLPFHLVHSPSSCSVSAAALKEKKEQQEQMRIGKTSRDVVFPFSPFSSTSTGCAHVTIEGTVEEKGRISRSFAFSSSQTRQTRL